MANLTQLMNTLERELNQNMDPNPYLKYRCVQNQNHLNIIEQPNDQDPQIVKLHQHIWGYIDLNTFEIITNNDFGLNPNQYRSLNRFYQALKQQS